jgi:hypothetical protein
MATETRIPAPPVEEEGGGDMTGVLSPTARTQEFQQALSEVAVAKATVIGAFERLSPREQDSQVEDLLNKSDATFLGLDHTAWNIASYVLIFIAILCWLPPQKGNTDWAWVGKVRPFVWNLWWFALVGRMLLRQSVIGGLGLKRKLAPGSFSWRVILGFVVFIIMGIGWAWEVAK